MLLKNKNQHKYYFVLLVIIGNIYYSSLLTMESEKNLCQTIDSGKHIKDIMHLQLLKDWLISWLAKQTPSKLEYKKKDGKFFFDTDNQSTKQILSIINCVKMFMRIDKANRLLLQANYSAYIGRLLNIYYFDDITYQFNQAICNTHTINYLDKCIKKEFYTRLLAILSRNPNIIKAVEEDAHIIIDLCAYSEGNWYVEPPKSMIVGKFGDYYDNAFIRLITLNRSSLPYFFNKVFTFAPYNSLTYNTRISKSMKYVPKPFWQKCNTYGLEVKTAIQYNLSNDLPTNSLEDQHNLFYVMSIQQIKNV